VYSRASVVAGEKASFLKSKNRRTKGTQTRQRRGEMGSTKSRSSERFLEKKLITIRIELQRGLRLVWPKKGPDLLRQEKGGGGSGRPLSVSERWEKKGG